MCTELGQPAVLAEPVASFLPFCESCKIFLKVSVQLEIFCYLCANEWSNSERLAGKNNNSKVVVLKGQGERDIY